MVLEAVSQTLLAIAIAITGMVAAFYCGYLLGLRARIDDMTEGYITSLENEVVQLREPEKQ
tara:strand:- start:3690 stop:3872 length:183 start_codon:yes stop_codon:yes gene_type:complete